MKYLILDDEPLSHEVIESYAAKLPFLTKVGNCYDGIEALDVLGQHHIDLLFLDIRMPKLGGYEFLKTLKDKPLVIAVTAHTEYAVEGYDLDLIDFLLKPFSFERFVRAVNKARDRLEGLSPSTTQTEPERHESFFLKDGKKHHQVRYGDTLYVEACGNYCLVITEHGKLITNEKLSELEKKLPPSFVRVHKSYLVSTHKIEWVESEELGVGGHRVPIGRVYKPNITKLLK